MPMEFELPGDRVPIRRQGNKLNIEPLTRPVNIVDLLAEWRTEAPLGPEDRFPDIADMLAMSDAAKVDFEPPRAHGFTKAADLS